MNKRKKTYLTLVFLVIFNSTSLCWGKALKHIEIAQQEIGKGEISKNNYGSHVRKYLKGKEGLSWCAGFVSYTLEKSGVKFKYSLGARDLFGQFERTNDPKSGDLILFWRDNISSWKGHIGIIEKVDDIYIYTIEGNVGIYPAEVRRFKYDKNKVPKLIGYAKIN